MRFRPVPICKTHPGASITYNSCSPRVTGQSGAGRDTSWRRRRRRRRGPPSSPPPRFSAASVRRVLARRRRAPRVADRAERCRRPRPGTERGMEEGESGRGGSGAGFPHHPLRPPPHPPFLLLLLLLPVLKGLCP